MFNNILGNKQRKINEKNRKKQILYYILYTIYRIIKFYYIFRQVITIMNINQQMFRFRHEKEKRK